MGVLSEFQSAQVFIETGLGHGQSLTAALAQPFEQLHSIDLNEDLILRFERQHGYELDPRLTLHQGSSPDVLPQIIDADRLTMFWLDAHYSAGQYTGDAARDAMLLDPRVGQCALLAELAVIRSRRWAPGCRPWIYIDDAVCFQAPVYEGMWAPYDRAQYPTMVEIAAALPPDYQLDVIDMLGAALRATPLERR
jgi:hypothetical protein